MGPWIHGAMSRIFGDKNIVNGTVDHMLVKEWENMCNIYGSENDR